MLRSIDKFDKLGRKGVELLLGAGRKDESGDFTKGAGLSPSQITAVADYVESGLGEGATTRQRVLEGWRKIVGGSAIGAEGIDELAEMGVFGLTIPEEFNSWIVLRARPATPAPFSNPIFSSR